MPPTAADAPVLLDTSAALALSVAHHEGHAVTAAALEGRQLGLAGHAAYETFSVLTRLPPSARLAPDEAARLLAANFPHTRFLSERHAADLLTRLPALGVAGGAVYDALVGAAAREHDLLLVSRDRRASETYRRLEVRVELL